MSPSAILRFSICLFAFSLIASCQSSPQKTDTNQDQRKVPETDRNKSQTLEKNRAVPSEEAVKKRVQKARARLQDSKAGKLVWQSIQAHGGLTTWYQNGPLEFRYDYKPLDGRTVRDTYQRVDTWASRARHQMPGDKSREYGWDGKQAWFKPADWKPPHHVAFWALTPYYFVGMPFVLSDPGVRLEYEGKAGLEGDQYHLIHVTFAPETGQSPDDYYYIYLDPNTKQLAALRYIVAYEEFFPDGGHSDEKLMTYDGTQKISGITFAKSYRFFMWNSEKKTDSEIVTEAELRDVAFAPETPDQYFDVPDAAKLWKNRNKGNKTSQD